MFLLYSNRKSENRENKYMRNIFIFHDFVCKSSKSEIDLEFGKKCFVVSILLILLRVKLTNKTGRNIYHL